MKQLGRIAQLTVNERIFHTRLVFDVTVMQGFATSLDTTVKAYNLSNESRNYVEHLRSPQKKMFLAAGYGTPEANNMGTLFGGDIFWAHTERTGPDLITTFQAGSGAAVAQSAYIVIRGAQNDYEVYQQILSRLKNFGVSQGYFSAAVKTALQLGTHSTPFSTSIMIDQLLKHLSSTYGFKFSVNNYEFNVHNPAEYEHPDAILLTPQTGLIGFPTKTKENFLEVKALLNPQLAPGRKIQVQSLEFGIDQNTQKNRSIMMKILKAKHKGDTLKGNYDTDMECASLNAKDLLGAFGA